MRLCRSNRPSSRVSDAASDSRSFDAATDQVINALRAHLAELGITAAQGNAGLRELLAIIAGAADDRCRSGSRSLLVLAAELQAMRTLIASIEKRIIAHHRSDEASKRCGASLGLVWWARPHCRHDHGPRHSGRPGFGGLDRARTAAGFDRRQAEARSDLETGRSLFATHSGGRSPCGVEARATEAGEVSLDHAASRRKPFKVVAVALANKMARIAWALLVKGALSAACTGGSSLRGLAMGG